MSQIKEVKRRIKSITNTKKITKAMELVAASKMKKAVSSVLATRDYSNLAWETAHNLAFRIKQIYHPLMQKRGENNIAVLVISSNRGLFGGFNSHLVANVAKFLKDHKSSKKDIISFGRKGRGGIARHRFNLIADYEKKDITSSIAEIEPLAQFIISEYSKGVYDKVYIAYTDYYSSLIQKPKIIPLLPLDIKTHNSDLGATNRFGAQEEEEKKGDEETFQSEYLFEPRAGEVLDFLLPRMVEILIYQAVLETEASEHSARMMAMRNASDAATDMINELTLIYNKARQASITKELTEIAGGAAALEQ